MKKAEDFRKAFGEADSGFENAVNDTLRELQAREEEPRGIQRNVPGQGRERNRTGKRKSSAGSPGVSWFRSSQRSS